MNFRERVSMFSEDSYLRGRVQSGAHEMLSNPGRESLTRGKPEECMIQ